MSRKLVLLTLLVGLGLIAAPAFADTVLDWQLAVCGGTFPCVGGDPTLIDPSAITMGPTGNHSAESPILILVGVPNSGSAPTLSGSLTTVSGAFFGLPNATDTTIGVLEGTCGPLNCSGNNAAYDNVGLAPLGNQGENYTNWSGFATAQGVTPGTFNIYAFAIDTTLTQNSFISFDLENISIGSIVFGYACTTVPSPITNQCDTTGDNVGNTPFTVAGGVGGVVPEPSTLLLLGGGLVGLAGIRRWKARR